MQSDKKITSKQSLFVKINTSIYCIVTYIMAVALFSPIVLIQKFEYIPVYAICSILGAVVAIFANRIVFYFGHDERELYIKSAFGKMYSKEFRSIRKVRISVFSLVRDRNIVFVFLGTRIIPHTILSDDVNNFVMILKDNSIPVRNIFIMD